MFKMKFVSLLVLIFMGLSVTVDSHPSTESYLLEKTIVTELKVQQLEKGLQELKASQNAERTAVDEEMTKSALSILELKSTYLSELEDLKNKVTREIAQIQDQLDSRRNLSVVAFNAYNPRDLNLGINDTIVFQNTFMNEGAAYDTNTGMFTAPVTGFYHFTAHTCCYWQKYATVAIVYNGTQVVISTQHAQQSSCGSASTLLRVGAGLTVHVDSVYKDTQMATGKHRLNTFIGMLIPYVE